LAYKSIPFESLVHALNQWRSNYPIASIAKSHGFARNTLKRYIAELKKRGLKIGSELPNKLELKNIYETLNKRIPKNKTVIPNPHTESSGTFGILYFSCHKISSMAYKNNQQYNFYLLLAYWKYSKYLYAFLMPQLNQYNFASAIHNAIIKFGVVPKKINLVSLKTNNTPHDIYNISKNESLSNLYDYYNIEPDNGTVFPKYFENINDEEFINQTAFNCINNIISTDLKRTWSQLVKNMMKRLQSKWTYQKEFVKMAIKNQQLPYQEKEFKELAVELQNRFYNAWIKTQDNIPSPELIVEKANICLNKIQSTSDIILKNKDKWEQEKSRLPIVDKKEFIVPKFKSNIKVGKDQHFIYNNKFISVPSQYIGEEIKCREQDKRLKIYCNKLFIREIILNGNKWQTHPDDFTKNLSIESIYHQKLQIVADKISINLGKLTRYILKDDPIHNYRYAVLVISNFTNELDKITGDKDNKNKIANLAAADLLADYDNEINISNSKKIKLAFAKSKQRITH
jgi:hypothetical protein